MSRDPIGERGGLNIYSIIANDTLNDWDYIGLSSGSRAGGFRNGGRSNNASRASHSNAQGSLLNVARQAGALPFDIASLDFLKPFKPSVIPTNKCNVLITVNGIFNTPKARDDLNDSVSKSPRYVGAYPIIFHNPTWYVGDLIQIVGDELGMIQTSSRRLAKEVNSVYDQFKKNGCGCGVIQVFAHSQGTMVFNRAIPLIKAEAKKMIYYTGIGGQIAIGGNHGFAIPPENYGNYADLLHFDGVPLANVMSPTRPIQLMFDGGFPDFIPTNDHPLPAPKPKLLDPLQHNYLKYYEHMVMGLQKNTP